MDDSKFFRKEIQTRVSPITFDSEINKPYISDETKAKLRNAKILIIPQDDYPVKGDRKVFPSGTIDLFKFISENLEDKNDINICIEDQEYQELGLHADLYIIAKFILLNIYVPLVIGLISTYLYDLIKGKDSETIIKSKIVVIDEKEKTSIEYSYTGPVNEYEKSLKSTIKTLSKN